MAGLILNLFHYHVYCDAGRKLWGGSLGLLMVGRAGRRGISRPSETDGPFSEGSLTCRYAEPIFRSLPTSESTRAFGPDSNLHSDQWALFLDMWNQKTAWLHKLCIRLIALKPLRLIHNSHVGTIWSKNPCHNTLLILCQMAETK